jgi:GMP synthase (glutamine-hydrolysing)
MNIHWLQHVPYEGLGCIETWANVKGHETIVHALFEQPSFPPPAEVDMLVVMGGPMSANDGAKYPWLTSEMNCIEGCIRLGAPVLGICLGAQLIASVLGARVYRNRYREIGWSRVRLTDDGKRYPAFIGAPGAFRVFQWHGETFDIAAGCSLVATGNACRNQAFSYDEHVLGLQFHLESTRGSVELLVNSGRDELVRGGAFVQTHDEIIGEQEAYEPMNMMMDAVMDSMAMCAHSHRI